MDAADWESLEAKEGALTEMRETGKMLVFPQRIGVTMSPFTTYAKPTNDYLTVRVPDEYRDYSFQVVLIPVKRGTACMGTVSSRPVWAGLCEGAITKNADGPHDMDSIRESIKSADRVSVS